MSGRLVGEVLKHAPADLTPAQMLVLVALAEQARERDRTARYAKVSLLAEYTRLKPGTVRNALSELTSRALIQRVHDRAHLGKIQQYRIAELAEHHRTAERPKTISSISEIRAAASESNRWVSARTSL